MLKPLNLKSILLIFRGFWSHLEAILAPLGPPGGPLGCKCLPGPSLDPPRTLHENLLESPGVDLGPNLSQHGANLGPTWLQLGFILIQLGANLDSNLLKQAKLE